MLPNDIGNKPVVQRDDRPFFHVVLDLETFSTAADGAIIAIGAVGCDQQFNIIGHFFTPIRLNSALELGLVVDAATINWWWNQDAMAKAGLDLERGLVLHAALGAFSTWIGSDHEKVLLWGNGSEFDNVLLDTAYRKYGTHTPWSFENNQSLRTLRYLEKTFDLKIEKPQPQVPHHALYDAEAEAIHLKLIMEALKEPHDIIKSCTPAFTE